MKTFFKPCKTAGIYTFRWGCRVECVPYLPCTANKYAPMASTWLRSPVQVCLNFKSIVMKYKFYKIKSFLKSIKDISDIVIF